jgi:hypothetical protein
MNETNQIAFRLNDNDFKIITDIAKSEGVSAHSYIKSYVKNTVLKKGAEDYFKLYLELGNLNLLLNDRIKKLEEQLLKEDIEAKVEATNFLFEAYKESLKEGE